MGQTYFEIQYVTVTTVVTVRVTVTEIQFVTVTTVVTVRVTVTEAAGDTKIMPDSVGRVLTVLKLNVVL